MGGIITVIIIIIKIMMIITLDSNTSIQYFNGRPLRLSLLEGLPN